MAGTAPGFPGLPYRPSDAKGLMHRGCVNYPMMSTARALDCAFEPRRRSLAIKVAGPPAFNEPESTLEAALDGLCIACILEEQAEPYIAAGRLAQMLEEWSATSQAVFSTTRPVVSYRRRWPHSSPSYGSGTLDTPQ